MFDMSNPRTREWLWNRLSGLTAEGVSGWWGDLGEPEVHPLTTIVHANGETAAEYHNVYGNEWSRTIYDGLRRDFPSMRPLLLMRGGTAGLQRLFGVPMDNRRGTLLGGSPGAGAGHAQLRAVRTGLHEQRCGRLRGRRRRVRARALHALAPRWECSLPCSAPTRSTSRNHTITAVTATCC